MAKAKQNDSMRLLRVSENIKRIISGSLNSSKILAHVIGDNYISVIEVKLSPDLKSAKVFIVPQDKENKGEILELINEYSWQIAKILGQELKSKFVPKLRFIYDDSYEKAHQINDIFNSLDDK